MTGRNNEVPEELWRDLDKWLEAEGMLPGNQEAEGQEDNVQEAGNQENRQQETEGQMNGRRRQVQFNDTLNVVAEYTIPDDNTMDPLPERQRGRPDAEAEEARPAGYVPGGEQHQEEEQVANMPEGEPAKEEDAGEELARQGRDFNQEIMDALENDLEAALAEEQAADAAEEEPPADPHVEEAVEDDRAARQREAERRVAEYLQREAARAARSGALPAAAGAPAAETPTARGVSAAPAAGTPSPLRADNESRTAGQHAALLRRKFQAAAEGRPAGAQTATEGRTAGQSAARPRREFQTAAEGRPAGAQTGHGAARRVPETLDLHRERRSPPVDCRFSPLAPREPHYSQNNLPLGPAVEDETTDDDAVEDQATDNLQEQEGENLANDLGHIYIDNETADLSSPVFNAFRDPQNRSEDALMLNSDYTNPPAENTPAAAAGPAATGQAAGLRGLFGLPTGPPRFDNLGAGPQRCSAPGTSVLAGAEQQQKDTPMSGGVEQDAQPAPQPGTGILPACGGASQPEPSTPRSGQNRRSAGGEENPGGFPTTTPFPEGETAAGTGRGGTPPTTVSRGPVSNSGTTGGQGEREGGSAAVVDTDEPAEPGTPAKRRKEEKKEEKKEVKKGGKGKEKEEKKEKEKKEKGERTPEGPRAVLTRRASDPLGPAISQKTSLRESTTNPSGNADSAGGILKSQGHRLKRPTTRAINAHRSPGLWVPGTPSSPDPLHLSSPFQGFFEDYFERCESLRSFVPPPVAGAADEPASTLLRRCSGPLTPVSLVDELIEYIPDPEPISNPSKPPNPRDQVPPWTDDSRRRPSIVPGPQASGSDVPETADQRLWSLPGSVARMIGSYVGCRGLGLAASTAACGAAGLLARAAMSRGDLYEYVLVDSPRVWYAGG